VVVLGSNPSAGLLARVAQRLERQKVSFSNLYVLS
jgi:hypothetical protein